MTASNLVTSQTSGILDRQGPVLAQADDALATALLTLATDLPSSTVVSGDDERTQASWWLGRVLGRRAGRAVLGFGHSGHYIGTGAYTFTRWEQRDYDWPRQCHLVLNEALDKSVTTDVYVSVLLHRAGTSGRIKDTVLPGALAWADVDGEWTAQRQQALDALGVESWQVSSGARGGRHVYVPIGESLDPQQLEGVNRRLGVPLGADDGWSCTKVLRLPGTWNHKPRAAGGASVPVRWVW